MMGFGVLHGFSVPIILYVCLIVIFLLHTES